MAVMNSKLNSAAYRLAEVTPELPQGYWTGLYMSGLVGRITGIQYVERAIRWPDGWQRKVNNCSGVRTDACSSSDAQLAGYNKAVELGYKCCQCVVENGKGNFCCLTPTNDCFTRAHTFKNQIYYNAVHPCD